MMFSVTLPKIHWSVGALSEKDGTTGITSTLMIMRRVSLESAVNSTQVNSLLISWLGAVLYGDASEEQQRGRWAEHEETVMLPVEYHFPRPRHDLGKSVSMTRSVPRQRVCHVPPGRNGPPYCWFAYISIHYFF